MYGAYIHKGSIYFFHALLSPFLKVCFFVCRYTVWGRGAFCASSALLARRWIRLQLQQHKSVLELLSCKIGCIDAAVIKPVGEYL